MPQQPTAGHNASWLSHLYDPTNSMHGFVCLCLLHMGAWHGSSLLQPCNIYQKDLAQCCTYSAPACKATLHAAVWALLGHEPLVFLPHPANSRQAATVPPASSLECACLCASVAKHSAATAARQLSVVL